MSCCKCAKKRGGLCPISFGLALGITSGLAVFLWWAWVINYGYGMSPMMEALRMPIPTWSESIVHALWCALKGFIFGFVLILLYDFFACCVKSMCCRKSQEACQCQCHLNNERKL